MRVNVGSGAVSGTVQIPLRPADTARSIALSSDGREIFAAIVNGSGRTRVVAVGVQSNLIRDVSIVDASVTYAYLEVGSRIGRLFAISEYQVGTVTVDATTGEQLSRFSFPRSGFDTDWHVYQARISPDERRLYVSFHGASSGIDWVDLDRTPPRSCDRAKASYARLGCIQAHGGFVPYGRGIIAAFGAGIVVVDSAGFARREFDVALTPQNHFMEFAFDSIARVVYRVGSCIYAGGLTAIALDSGARRAERVLDSSAEICGGAAILSPDRAWVVVTPDHKLHDSPVGDLTIIDLKGRLISHRIPIESDVLGMVFISNVR